MMIAPVPSLPVQPLCDRCGEPTEVQYCRAVQTGNGRLHVVLKCCFKCYKREPDLLRLVELIRSAIASANGEKDKALAVDWEPVETPGMEEVERLRLENTRLYRRLGAVQGCLGSMLKEVVG